MNQKIFDDYGIEIFRASGKYFIEVDSGETVSKPIVAEVSVEDSMYAQKSPQAAYEILLKYQKKGAFKAAH